MQKGFLNTLTKKEKSIRRSLLTNKQLTTDIILSYAQDLGLNRFENSPLTTRLRCELGIKVGVRFDLFKKKDYTLGYKVESL